MRLSSQNGGSTRAWPVYGISHAGAIRGSRAESTLCPPSYCACGCRACKGWSADAKPKAAPDRPRTIIDGLVDDEKSTQAWFLACWDEAANRQQIHHQSRGPETSRIIAQIQQHASATLPSPPRHDCLKANCASLEREALGGLPKDAGLVLAVVSLLSR